MCVWFTRRSQTNAYSYFDFSFNIQSPFALGLGNASNFQFISKCDLFHREINTESFEFSEEMLNFAATNDGEGRF